MPKFNVITDKPEEYSGIIVNTDFKSVLKFFRVLEAQDLNEEEKTRLTIKLFFNGKIPHVENLWEEIETFICYDSQKGEKSSGAKVFDYNADHGRIFAAFWETYNIDLRNTDMHWFVFRELFDAIPEKTKLMQVIDIRGKKLKKEDSAEYKKQIMKLKNIYRLDTGDNIQSALDRW
jgi:hypothetical protein